jgi:hypothetical protein
MRNRAHSPADLAERPTDPASPQPARGGAAADHDALQALVRALARQAVTEIWSRPDSSPDLQ